MRIDRIDFSQFHPLDHWPGGHYCRSLPGGTRRHLGLTWDHRRRDQLAWPWHRLILCPLGHHRTNVWWQARGRRITKATARCDFCPYEREPTPAELAHATAIEQKLPRTIEDNTDG